MARLCLLGDSNVHTSVPPNRLASAVGHSVHFYRATNRMSVENYLAAAQRENYEVLVLSVFSNLICDLSVGSLPSSLSVLYEGQISKLVSLGIKKILLVPPVQRFQLTWYPENHSVMLKLLQESLSGIDDIHLLPNFPITISDLGTDGIHFLPETGKRFFDNLVSSIKDVIDTEVVAVPKPSLTLEDLADMIKSSVPEVASKVTKF